MASKKVHVTVHAVVFVPEEVNLHDLHAKTIADELSPSKKRLVLTHDKLGTFDIDPRITYIKPWEGFPK